MDIKRLSFDTALSIDRAATSECRSRGIQIGFIVVDRGGHTQVALRDTVATGLTLRSSWDKGSDR